MCQIHLLQKVSGTQMSFKQVCEMHSSAAHLPHSQQKGSRVPSVVALTCFVERPKSATKHINTNYSTLSRSAINAHRRRVNWSAPQSSQIPQIPCSHHAAYIVSPSLALANYLIKVIEPAAGSLLLNTWPLVYYMGLSEICPSSRQSSFFVVKGASTTS